MDSPHSVYSQRLAERAQKVEVLNRSHIRLGNARLALAFLAAVLAWLAFGEHAIARWWIALPVGGFIAVAFVHDGVLRRKSKAERALSFYRHGLERLADRWAGSGETGERFLDTAHPYAQDLDLFGQGGLFELISSARTRAGEQTLARWLLEPTDVDQIRQRQQAVNELRSRLDLREDIAVLGEDVRVGVHPEPLAQWGAAPPLLRSGWLRVLAFALSVLAVATAVVWYQTGVRLWFFLVVAAIAVLELSLRRRVQKVIQAVEQPSHDLALLSQMLQRVECEQFESQKLARLRAQLELEGDPPSRRIARLHRWMELLDSRDHVALRALGLLVLWVTQLAFAVEAWRLHSGPLVRGWLDALGEIEALSSLAGYAYEHPDDPFPEFTPDTRFEAEAIGHPLLPRYRVVLNDVRIDAAHPLWIVSGSNMSGKSTLLRTIGINAVLAMAGAPVRASRLHISPLAIGAAIRVTDSLQSGASRFYAEISRLRRFMDMARGETALLFLLDELLHGTNSHDRGIGGEAVIRGLVERGAIGLFTTHDLVLTGIAEKIRPPGDNVHFEDHLEDGRLTFDYKLRPGVVHKSNALDLMRSIGLEV
jgi:hypothetical protein